MHLLRRLLLVALCAALTLPAASPSTAAPAVAPTSRSVVVFGDEATTYPAYQEGVSRFGVRTTQATGGTLTVQATSSDPEGVVVVNGRPVTNGAPIQVTGLRAGDEVNVQIDDAEGLTNQSWFYLPPGFPALATTTAGEGPEPGQTLLTLGGATDETFVAAVDEAGVPSFVIRHDLRAANLAMQPSGRLAVAFALDRDLWGNYEVWQLDAQHRLDGPPLKMLGQPKTDFHDFVLLPGGGRIVMAYIKRPDGQTDSRFQEVAPDGKVVLSWNSDDHVDEAVDVLSNGLGDYAHLNSIDIMDDGDLLLSFRHLSQVMKVDRTTGEVLWRLGGVRSDFTFPDDPLGGPCAQHTARELANGDIQIFDNGSVAEEPMCPDPLDPDGARVGRPESRSTVYRLDEEAGTASLVEERATGSFNRYAGSSQRLGANTLDDHLLLGLNDGYQPDFLPAPDVIEMDGDGDTVWSLDAQGSTSYRAERATVPDATPPVIRVQGLTDGATLVEDETRRVQHQCFDTGGSNLDDCSAAPADGRALDMSVGTHRLTLSASDRAGNTTTQHLDYTVRRAHQPDVAVRRNTGGAWIGTGVLGRPAAQRVTLGLTGARRQGTAYLRVRNTGARAERLRVVATQGRARFGARWLQGRTDVTRRLGRGMLTPVLKPGQTWVVRLVVSRAPGAPAGASRVFQLRATSQGTPSRSDAASVKAVAR